MNDLDTLHPERRLVVARHRVTRVALCFMLPLAAASACSSGSGNASKVAPALGSPCSTDADCGSTLRCGANAHGGHVCVGVCSSYAYFVQDGVPSPTGCVAGLATPCELLPTDTTCGCSCPSGDYCSLSVDGMSGRCVPLLAQGAGCDRNWKCSSRVCFSCDSSTGNCEVPPVGQGTCSVPLTAPCTVAPGKPDCASCFVSRTEPSWCSAPCQLSAGSMTTSTCPSGFVCLGGSGAQVGNCYLPCKSSGAACFAGTSCMPYGGGDGYACQYQ